MMGLPTMTVPLTIGVVFAATTACGVPPTGAVALDDRTSVAGGRTVEIDVLANDRPPVGETLLVTGVDPAAGAVAIDPTGRLIYTAPTAFDGVDEFGYSVASDRSGSVAVALVRVVVSAANTTTSTATTAAPTTSTATTTTLAPTSSTSSTTSTTTTSTTSTTTTSTTTTTRPLDTSPPSIPQGVVAAASVVGEAVNVNVSWEPSDDDVGVAGYEVFRDGTLLDRVPANETSIDDGSVEFGARYTYQIVAFDQAGNRSEPSRPSTASTAPPPDTTSPSPPRITTARQTWLIARGIELAWEPSTDDGSGMAGYRIERLSAEDGVATSWEVIANLTSSRTSIDDRNDREGWQYIESCRDMWVDYRVIAIDRAGNEARTERRVVFEDECIE